MRNFNPKEKQTERDSSAKKSEGFNREDSGRSTGYSQFSKDKRARTSGVKRVEKVTRETRPERSDSHSTGKPEQRRSYNPNFTKDNKFSGGSRPKRDYSDKEGRPNYDRSATPEKGERNDRPKYGDNAGRTERPYRSSGARSGDYKHKEGYSKPGEKGGYSKSSYAGKSGEGYKKDGARKTSYSKERAPGEYPKFPAPKFDNAIRLNRYIATSGICSRREADDFISAGLVSVNGKVITELGTKVLNTDEIKFNDSVVRSEKKVYILMNKPKGFVTTIEDPHADKTVMDIVKSACSERVYPVGRLDKNSVGVLLITNDGDLTKQLTHPTYLKKKIYQVALDKPLTKADMEQLAKGVTLEDGEIFADEISYVGESKRDVGIEIHSGRNRIVRRMFEHVGYKVQKLDRVYFAGLTKKSLKRGAWRYLTPREVAMLKSGEYE